MARRCRVVKMRLTSVTAACAANWKKLQGGLLVEFLGSTHCRLAHQQVVSYVWQAFTGRHRDLRLIVARGMVNVSLMIV